MPIPNTPRPVVSLPNRDSGVAGLFPGGRRFSVNRLTTSCEYALVLWLID
jgi:hypothetical protein